MKKSFIIALVAMSIGCKKSNDNKPTVDNSIKSKIIGTWTCTKNVTTYTDLSGKGQVYNNGYLYVYTISDKTATKMAGTSNVYSGNTPYNIFSSRGKNYIHFEVVANDTGDTYEIVSLNAHSLVLNAYQGDFYKNGTGQIIGSNAVIDEEYSK